MSTYAERLRQAMKKKGITQQVLAERIGIKQQSIQYLCKMDGKEKKSTHTAQIARVLGVSPEWLADGQMGIAETRTEYATHSHVVSVSEMFAKVPRYSAELSAGHGAHVADEADNGFLYFRRDWLKRRNLDVRHLCVVDVRGNSMEPTICDNDVILVDSSDRHSQISGIADGFIYAISIDDDALVKRLFKKPGGGIIVRSDSPSPQYRDVIIDGADLSYLRIIGRAVWHAGDL